MNKSKLIKFLIINTTAITLAAAGYMLTPARYISKMVIGLNGAKTNSSVILPESGVIRDGINQTYAVGSSLDPRETYKNILLSEQSINELVNKYGYTDTGIKPKVKVIQPTTALEISIKGNSPTDAQTKLIRIKQQFESKVNNLRKQESQLRQQDVLGEVNKAKQELIQTQQELLKFRLATGLNLETQISQLINDNRDLEDKLLNLQADLKAKTAQINLLKSSAKVNNIDLANNLQLQGNKLLNAAVDEYIKVSTELDNKLVTLTKENPIVLDLQERKNRLANQISADKKNVNKVVKQVGEQDSEKQKIYIDVINLNKDIAGLTKQITELSNALSKGEKQLKVFTTNQPQLIKLTRDYEAASVIYNNLVSQVKLQVDKYGTYPLFQVIESPSLPSKPSTPNGLYAGAGGLVTVVITNGVLLLMYKRAKDKQ